ncbi:AlbA family DNA-binding domain-containing protein [Brevundimonas sp.]|jgi:hypothetical protein|uniref:AlbA family DNA-binding domain-containing protein n=1 Tax=Brevundimonas sp. TaxID=1871086 RepID=UPI003D0C5B46
MAKQTIDWTVADLEALIGSEETSNLEFKDGRSLLNEPKKKEEIARDVSAMANAAGGIIVYGLHETNGVATSIAGCPAEYGKAEWFDQVITNNIEPKVQGVVIKRIDLPEGKMALVVEIPKAMSFAPHQSKPNKIYYRRYNTTIQPMLDHEVRDLMRRSTAPELYLKPLFVADASFGRDVVRDVQMDIHIGNRAAEPSLYTDLDVMLDAALMPQQVSAGWSIGDVLMGGQMANHYRRWLIAPEHMPIFAEREQKIMSIRVTVRPNTIYQLSYIISAPGFRKVEHLGLTINGDGRVIASPTDLFSSFTPPQGRVAAESF